MLRVDVHLVVLPYIRRRGVYAVYKETASGQIFVPPCALAVLHEEELILYRRVYLISGIGGVEGIERKVVRPVYYLRLCKAQGMAFVYRIAARRARHVEIRSLCHYRPFPGVHTLSARLFVVGVVQVRKSEHMAELVADSADAVQLFVSRFAV